MNEFTALCKAWIKKHNLNSDNFDIIEKEIQIDRYYKTRFFFVYNKAFAKPFINESSISEMSYNAEFVFKTDFGDSITVEKDSKGSLAGKHGWATRMTEELSLDQIATLRKTEKGFDIIDDMLGNALEDLDKASMPAHPSANSNGGWPFP